MNRIILKSLSLSFFKGIKSLSIDFSEYESWIYAQNEAGKSTLFDAIWFLFWGKDSSGRADFSIKTYDANNVVIPKVEHEVSAIFEINGTQRTFRRIYKEVWSKSENILKTHTTDYWVDDFPVRTETEYKKIVNELFDEQLFKLLSNPLFFNSLKPDERRAALIGLADSVSDTEIIDELVKKHKTNSLKVLQEQLNLQSDLDRVRQKYALDKRNLKAEKESIPSRIDEQMRTKPNDYNWSELQEAISEKKKELGSIDNLIADSNHKSSLINKKNQDIQQSIYDLERQLNSLKHEAQMKADTANRDLGKYSMEIQGKMKSFRQKADQIAQDKSSIKSKIIALKNDSLENEKLINRLEEERKILIDKWTKINAEQITPHSDSCPTCLREFDSDTSAELLNQHSQIFNQDKRKRLLEVESQGMTIKGRIDSLKVQNNDDRIRDLSKQVEQADADLFIINEDLMNLENALKEELTGEKKASSLGDFLSDEFWNIKKKIEQLETSKDLVTVDNSELTAQKSAVVSLIEGLQNSLANKEQIEKIQARIKELKDVESELAIRISEMEGVEDAIFLFSKTRIEKIEKTINSKFKLVYFKMFDFQMDGKEKQICDTIYKGVPFPDLNTAGKIQAGLDIINTFSDHYSTWIPVFIDNRESVHLIPESQSQIINLVASKEHKTLTVLNNSLELQEK